MPELDMLSSLHILNILLGFSLATVTLSYIKYHHRVQSIELYILFYLFSLFGSIMITNRVFFGEFLSIIVANVFMFAGLTFLAAGIYRFNKKQLNWKWYGSMLIVYTFLFVYFTYINPNVSGRILVYGLMALVITIDCIRIEFNRTLLIGRGQNLMLSVLLLMLGTQLFRISRVLITQENYVSFFEYNIDAFSVFILGISYMLISFGMLESISSRFSGEIAESERSVSSLLSNLPGFAYRCAYDEQYTMHIMSDAFQDMTGYEVDDFVMNKERSFSSIILPEFIDGLQEAVNHAVEYQTSYIYEYQIQTNKGDPIWVWEQGKGVYDDAGNVVALEGYIADIDDRKKMEQNLEYLSYRDYLTGLYNRRFIEEEMDRLDVKRNLPISIIIADMNGLKFINDSFGHKEGDNLLQLTATLFRQTLRKNELIARLGGDEFIIFMENTSHEHATHILNRIQTELQKDIYVKKGLSISFGVSTKTEESEPLTSTVKDAEDKMYENKIYQRPSSRRKAVDTVLGTLFEKDQLSETHSHEVSKYSTLLAQAKGLPQSQVDKIATAALLHDVGKIIIDSSILTKKSRLTKEEYEEIKKHPEIGYRILSSVPEFQEIANIIMHHHERPDGKGYPNGITLDEIPLESRIISIADAFDAMVGKRLYRKRMTVEQAIKEIKQNKGTQFDSELVDLFIKVI